MIVIHHFACLNLVIDIPPMTFSDMKSQYSVKKFASNKKKRTQFLLKYTSDQTQVMRESLDMHHIFVCELFDNQTLFTEDN